MTESEFKKEFGMSFDEAYQRLIDFRQKSEDEWFYSINQFSASEEVKASMSYQIKWQLKLEATIELLREIGYDV